MDRPNIYEFFSTMPQTEFEQKFLELSRTDHFSAVASGVGNRQDVARVKNDLIVAGVDKDWLEKDNLLNATIHHITHRIMNAAT